jgi:hypothetical protein
MRLFLLICDAPNGRRLRAFVGARDKVPAIRKRWAAEHGVEAYVQILIEEVEVPTGRKALTEFINGLVEGGTSDPLHPSG